MTTDIFAHLNEIWEEFAVERPEISGFDTLPQLIAYLRASNTVILWRCWWWYPVNDLKLMVLSETLLKYLRMLDHGALMRSITPSRLHQADAWPCLASSQWVPARHTEPSMDWQSNSLKIYGALACLRLICSLWRTKPHSWASYEATVKAMLIH